VPFNCALSTWLLRYKLAFDEGRWRDIYDHPTSHLRTRTGTRTPNPLLIPQVKTVVKLPPMLLQSNFGHWRSHEKMGNLMGASNMQALACSILIRAIETINSKRAFDVRDLIGPT
jgi:hypothetical protein